MSEEYYSDDDYDQEYAEGYSAYKYDDDNYFSDYENPYTDGYEEAEEEYVDEFVEGDVDNGEYDGEYEDQNQTLHQEVSQTSSTAPHHVIYGAAGAALRRPTLNHTATNPRQQLKAKERKGSTSYNAPSLSGKKVFLRYLEGFGYFMLLLFFILLLFKCCE